MVNEEIVGGLISGLERGESLKRAMMSMFSAGYKKEEIEEAARIVNGLEINLLQKKEPQKTKSNPLLEKRAEERKKNSSPLEVRQLPPLPKIAQNLIESRDEERFLFKPVQKETPFTAPSSSNNFINNPIPYPTNRGVVIPPQTNYPQARNPSPRQVMPPQQFPPINQRELVAPRQFQNQMGVPINPAMQQNNYPPNTFYQNQQYPQNVGSPYYQGYAPQKQNQTKENKSKQKVSNYSQPKPSGDTLIIVILILLLVFLVGALISIFVFKQEIIDFLSSLLN